MAFDVDALRQKYADERDRRLRADGIAQYRRDRRAVCWFRRRPLERSEFHPRSVVRRGRCRDHRRRLRRPADRGPAARARRAAASGSSTRPPTSAAPGTGTAIPGIACDVESYVYLPLLEELGYVPTEKYAKGDEIFAHCRRIAEHYDLYRDACLQTEVTEIRWDAAAFPLDRLDQPRRRDPGAVRGDGQRVPAEAETARHRRHHGLPRARVPHQPLGLRLHRHRPGQAGGQAGRDHRHRRHRGPVRAAPGADRRSSCSCSSARRRRSTCAATGRPTRTGRRTSKTAGSAAASRTSSCSPPAARPTRTWSTTAGRASSRSCS